ncbi:MAG: formyl transferase [Candidatus Competibacterales bacterium]
MRVIVLTGAELRHRLFRRVLATTPGVEVVASYCEGLEKSLPTLVAREADNAWRRRHLEARERSERDFFQALVAALPEHSNPVALAKGAINDALHVAAIEATAPDLVLAYGCSLIKSSLLQTFRGRLVNLHLGLSPYYRGSGTNYWPLVNGEPEYVGATWLHMDEGIDTGAIIHQHRAVVAWGDSPSQIGNRLILHAAKLSRALVTRFTCLEAMPQPAVPAAVRVYRKRDYSEASVAELYRQFESGLVARYLAEASSRQAAAPIVHHPRLLDLEPEFGPGELLP